jgi:hypothetical protein
MVGAKAKVTITLHFAIISSILYLTLQNSFQSALPMEISIDIVRYESVTDLYQSGIVIWKIMIVFRFILNSRQYQLWVTIIVINLLNIFSNKNRLTVPLNYPVNVF